MKTFCYGPYIGFPLREGWGIHLLQKTSTVFEIRLIPSFSLFVQRTQGAELRSVRNRLRSSRAIRFHFRSKLCTECNCRSPAQAQSLLGLEDALHDSALCTKSRRKARRLEGDKCFLGGFFLTGSFSSG